VHSEDKVSNSDSVSSAIWKTFSAQSSFVFLRETRFPLRECEYISLERSTNIPNDDMCRLVPLSAAWCRWCGWCRWCRLVPLVWLVPLGPLVPLVQLVPLVPLGAAGVAGAAGATSSEQSAHNSVRKQQAELKSTRLTMFNHMKISKDEVSSANINP